MCKLSKDIGCLPAIERSMMESRLCPKPIIAFLLLRIKVPSPSGPL